MLRYIHILYQNIIQYWLVVEIITEYLREGGEKSVGMGVHNIQHNVTLTLLFCFTELADLPHAQSANEACPAGMGKIRYLSTSLLSMSYSLSQFIHVRGLGMWLCSLSMHWEVQVAFPRLKDTITRNLWISLLV